MRALVARLLLSMPSQLVTYLKSDTYHTDRPMMGTGYIGLSTWKVYLTALFTDRHTDKYDLKVRHSTLRTLTNSFTLRVRNKYCRIFRNLFSLALYARGPDRSLFTNCDNKPNLKNQATRIIFQTASEYYCCIVCHGVGLCSASGSYSVSTNGNPDCNTTSCSIC